MKKLQKEIKTIISHNPNDEWYDEKKHLNEASERIIKIVKDKMLETWIAGLSPENENESFDDWFIRTQSKDGRHPK